MKIENAIFCACGLITGYIISSSLSNKSPTNDMKSREHGNSFLLCVELKFKDNEALDRFKVIFKPFAEWVRLNEFGTISYELFQNEKAEKTAYILERYKTKADYLDIHRKSIEFLNFKSELLKLSDRYEMNGNGYIQSDFGFV